jgi:hypothetical protein
LVQLSEAALSAEMMAGPWIYAGDGTVLGSLDAIFAKEFAPTSSNNRRIRITGHALPPDAALLAPGMSAPFRVALGMPSGSVEDTQTLKMEYKIDGFLHINSAPLLRLLRDAHTAAAAAGAQLAIALRVDPAAHRCCLWLAPSGATGAALEAPTLPAGVEQLSEAALAVAAART